MRCPCCHITMTLRKSEHLQIQSCTGCGGVWLEFDAFAAMAGQQAHVEKISYTHRRSARRCSKCQVRYMELRSFEGVDVDTCRACRVIWFDKGELDKILATRRANRKVISKPKAQPATFSSGSSSSSPEAIHALEWLEIIGDGVSVLAEVVVDVVGKTPEAATDAAGEILSCAGDILSGW